MKNEKNIMLLIKLPYWLGIGLDALWAVGLFFPQLFSILTGRPDFNPDFETKQILGIAGTLMTGWTLLLLWGVKKPIERKGVILLTAFPVVFGLFIVAINSFFNGNTSFIWILIKLLILFVTMIISYILARKMDKRINPGIINK